MSFTTRSVKGVYPSVKVNMGGVLLDQPLPYKGLDMVDPFLLIHHWEDDLPGGQHQSKAGVGPHPHRGFAPVSFIFKGGVHHRDSEGHESVIYAGGTQWMNSGFGLVHSERPAKELAESGGPFELIQFWVNAPAKHKLDKANYQPLTAEDTPSVRSSDGKVSVGVVAGTFLGAIGPIETHSPLLTLRMEIGKGGRMQIPIPSDFNVVVYLLDGSIKINDDQVIEAKDMLVLNNDGDGLTLEGIHATRAILLAGQPINEPVVSYGPFVMNSEKELMEAISDYQSGKMGTLEEEFN
ncbi:MAG: pirin family protein [Cryomorphaceae bacterium]